VTAESGSAGAVWWAVTVNSSDPVRLAAFWGALLDTPVVEPGPDRPGWRRLQPLAPHGPFVNVQPVPPAEEAPSRLHLDVLVADIEAAVARVVELGGADTGARETLPRGRIAIMRDADGNEFCLLAPPDHVSDRPAPPGGR
jgi:predicted enzyme related to lactoylglutathione lyase